MGRERVEIFHLLVYFLNTGDNQGWVNTVRSPDLSLGLPHGCGRPHVFEPSSAMSEGTHWQESGLEIE